jgi:hypothetical protein
MSSAYEMLNRLELPIIKKGEVGHGGAGRGVVMSQTFNSLLLSISYGVSEDGYPRAPRLFANVLLSGTSHLDCWSHRARVS